MITCHILGEAIDKFYFDETDDNSSGFYGSSANNTRSISINKKYTYFNDWLDKNDPLAPYWYVTLLMHNKLHTTKEQIFSILGLKVQRSQLVIY